MSTLPKLSTRSHILVHPEMVDGAIEYPCYMKISKTSKDEAVGCDSSGNEWTVSTSAARAHVVPKRLVDAFPDGPLDRHAVRIQWEDQFHYGQVISSSVTTTTVALLDEQAIVGPSEVTVVAPVVAVLLHAVTFALDEWSPTELDDLEQDIIDRIMGSDVASGSRSIAKILDAIVPKDSLPNATSSMTWIDPRSGTVCAFHVQHAIDYAYFVDGQVSPVPRNVGTSFCREGVKKNTLQNVAPLQKVSYLRNDAVTTLFDPQIVDEEDAEDVDEVRHVSLPKVTRTAAPKRQFNDHAEEEAYRESKRPATAPSQSAVTDHAKDIMALLIGRPELLQHYLTLLQRDQSQEAFVTSPDHAWQHDERPPAGRSKYQFAPSTSQQRIHEQITSVAHQGTPPSVFVEGLINAGAVLFKPHPGVLSRIYDFQFGVRGLSLLHFKRFSMWEKVDWLNGGGANLQNFSASAGMPTAVAAKDIADVVDAGRTLARYAAEYFNSATRHLIDTMVDFLQLLASWHEWATQDLPQLVFWVNSTLEEFRTTIETGAQHGTNIEQRFSMANGELQNLLHVIQARRFQALAAIKPPTSATRQGGKDNMARIPADILSVIPVKGGRPMCLRFLSAKGCNRGGPKCFVPGRVHFVPSELDPRVKAIIEQRYGGMKPEHASL